jgi:hypothetical protein
MNFKRRSDSESFASCACPGPPAVIAINTIVGKANQFTDRYSFRFAPRVVDRHRQYNGALTSRRANGETVVFDWGRRQGWSHD